MNDTFLRTKKAGNCTVKSEFMFGVEIKIDKIVVDYKIKRTKKNIFLLNLKQLNVSTNSEPHCTLSFQPFL